MTNKYDDIFNYAALARSSYADLSEIIGIDDSEGIQSAIKKYDESEEFARQIADKYYVLAHYKDRDNHGINPIGSILSIFNSESGFSGTLFRDKGTQEYVMAFKGTDGAKDLWITDVADIVSNGAAHNQIIDMYNFWQQIIHSGEKINGKPARNHYRAIRRSEQTAHPSKHPHGQACPWRCLTIILLFGA